MPVPWSQLRMTVAVCVLCATAVGARAQPALHATTRVSVAPDGSDPDRSSSSYPAISADGRFVAFASHATNLVAGDTNLCPDVFVRDRTTGITTRVSVASDGTQLFSFSSRPVISADGRFVAFTSGAEILVHDRETGATTPASVASDGTPANQWSSGAAISADGRFVAFRSSASNLVAGDTNDAFDVFVHDRVSGVTTRVSVTSAGAQTAGSAPEEDPAISADGRYVAFTSSATDLVAGDTNGVSDVFVHDRETGATTLVSVASDGTQADDYSGNPAISADGRFVAFMSFAANLVAGDTNGCPDVFVHDRATGITTRVSVATDGTQGDRLSEIPAISGDGRFVAFTSNATNLAGGDTTYDVFVHDRETGSTTQVSVATDGTPGNWGGASETPAISADGRSVVFTSLASNLVADDTNGYADVFVHDLWPASEQPEAASLWRPAPGSTLMSPTVTFGWTGGSGVSEFALYVGTGGPGGYDIYCTSHLTSLSATVSGLPIDGRTIYVRLWSHLAGGWQYQDYTYTATTVVLTRARLTTPTPGSMLTASEVTFQWTADSGVSQIVLYVGTEGPGSYDVYYASQGTSLSAPVSGLPVDGRTVYVRLWSWLNADWQYEDSTYRATTGAAALQTPVPGSTLAGSGVTFGWTAGSGASQVVLYVGTGGPGSYDVYYASQGSRLSAPVSRLPVDGSTVYVRLWSCLGGEWQYEDYTYQAVTGRARLQAPAPGSALTSSSVTFGWTEGGEVSQVALYVGNGGVGSYDLYAAFQGTNLSATVSGLPTDGRTIYVRLWSYLRGAWQYDDYSYQASTGANEEATLTAPAPGTTLASSSVTFGWSAGSDVSQTALYVGSEGVGSFDLYAAYQGTSSFASVSELPADGRTIYVRLWSFLRGAWQYDDYIYKATTGGAQMTIPAPRSTLTSSTVAFGWTVPRGVLSIRLYVGIGGPGSYDIYFSTQDLSGFMTIGGLPTNGETIYVRLWSNVGGRWQYGDYTYTAMK